MYEVEKGVPLPAGSVNGRKRKYPVLDMEVGDSFFVPCGEGIDVDLIRSTVSVSVHSKRRNGGGRFVVRKLENPLGVRVWRIE